MPRLNSVSSVVFWDVANNSYSKMPSYLDRFVGMSDTNENWGTLGDMKCMILEQNLPIIGELQKTWGRLLLRQSAWGEHQLAHSIEVISQETLYFG